MISLVVAQANDRVIGQDNAIPWRMRDDLVKLKRLTVGQVVILGRRTYDSMDEYYKGSGRPMPGRIYIVVTRNRDFKPERDNAVAVHSVDEALQRANGDDAFVIGGGQIFAEAPPVADRIYMTQVKADIDGDSLFPELDPKQWRVTEREAHEASERNEYPFEFLTLERVV